LANNYMSKKNKVEFIDYVNPTKSVPAFGKAAMEAFTAKGKSLRERFNIFLDIFQKEMGAIDKEKEEVTGETNAKVEQGVQTTLAEVTTAASLDTDKVTVDEKEQFDQVLAIGTKRLKDLPKKSQSAAYSGLDKLDKSFEGKTTEKMNAAELASVGAIGIGMIIDLKKKSTSEADLAKKLEKLYATSEHSNYPLKKALSFSVLDVFSSPDTGVQAALLEKLGLKVGVADLDIPGASYLAGIAPFVGQEAGGDGKAVLEGFDGIDKKTFSSAQVAKAARVLKQFFTPRTSQGNAEKLIVIFNKLSLSGGSGHVEPKTIARIAYLVHDSDLENLFEKLSKA